MISVWSQTITISTSQYNAHVLTVSCPCLSLVLSSHGSKSDFVSELIPSTFNHEVYHFGESPWYCLLALSVAQVVTFVRGASLSLSWALSHHLSGLSLCWGLSAYFVGQTEPKTLRFLLSNHDPLSSVCPDEPPGSTGVLSASGRSGSGSGWGLWRWDRVPQTEHPG